MDAPASTLTGTVGALDPLSSPPPPGSPSGRASPSAPTSNRPPAGPQASRVSLEGCTLPVEQETRSTVDPPLPQPTTATSLTLPTSSIHQPPPRPQSGPAEPASRVAHASAVVGLGLTDGLPSTSNTPSSALAELSALGSGPPPPPAPPRPQPPSRSASAIPTFALGRASSTSHPTSGLFVSRTKVWNAAEHVGGGGGEGVWRVSVAADEGAGTRGKGKGKVCVYAQSATHNYTLLRTVKEVRETYDKLASTHASSSLPPFPPASLSLLGLTSPNSYLAQPPAGRRSSIRRAFSRLRDGSRERSSTSSSVTLSTTFGSSSSATGATAAAGTALLSPPRSPIPVAGRLDKVGTPTIEEEDPMAAGTTNGGNSDGGGGPGPLPPIPTISPLLTADEHGLLGQSGTERSTTPSTSSVDVEGAVDGSSSSGGRKADGDAPAAGAATKEQASPMASLSALLTTLANDRAVRESRAWRRFVRVRGDDMSSVRVERKIVRTHSVQGLHQSASLSSSIKGLGRSLRPSRPTADGSSSTDDLADDGVLVEKDEGGAELPHENNVEPAGRAGGSSPFGKRRRAGADSDGDKAVAGKVSPLLAPIQLLAKGEDPFAPTPRAPVAPLTTRDAPTSPPPPPAPIDNSSAQPVSGAPSLTPSTPLAASVDDAAAYSPPFPEDDGRPPSTTVASPLPPRPSLDDPDVSHHKVLASREAARHQAMLDAAYGRADEADQAAAAEGGKGDGPRKRVRIAGRRKVGIDDFELIRVLGKGCAGKVLLVRKKDRDGGSGGPLLALKSIVKRHVLAHQELQHTLTEQAVLRRMSRDVKNPFVVHLHYSFHDKDNLFLVMDFHPGGDLATQLARWGKFGRDRARFYAAEIVEGVQGLHAAGVIYRDLKPENILLDAAGHLILTDFGLSKEFPRQALSSPPVALSNGDVAGFDLEPEAAALPRYMQPVDDGLTDQQRLDWAPSGDRLADQTGTFCGTAEYLAPEVIQGLPYSYPVDWWSFGTLLFEMLVGMTPFWAQNHSDMYLRVLHDELVFPDERPIDQDTKSLLRGLLQRNPALRLGEPRIKKHPYFQMISWDHIYHKRYIPPYTPPTDPENAMDTQNFDEAFLDMDPTIEGDAGGDGLAAEPSAINAAAAAEMEDRASLWGGYSYRERDAASIFTLASEQDGSWGRKSSEILRTSIDSGRLVRGALIEQEATPPTPEDDQKAPVADSTTHQQEPSKSDSVDSVDRPPPEASTSGSSLDESLPDPPLSPVSVHAHIGRTGIAAVDRDRVSDSEAEPALDGESDDDDDEWDVIEKPRAGLQDQNGSKGATFFARGVVDRYRFGQIKKKESKALLSRQQQHAPQTPSVSPPTPTETPTPPSTVSSRRGLTFKGGRFRRKEPSESQRLGELRTAPSTLIKNSKSTPSSLSRSPFGAPTASPSLPSGLGTPATNGSSPASSPHRQLSSRSSSLSPTKASSRMASTAASEDEGAGSSGSRFSSGEKLKLFGRSGQEKVLNLFKA